MTLLIYKDGKLHADRLSLVEVGHTYQTVVKSAKLFDYGDHAIGVCGEFNPDSVLFKEMVRLLRIVSIGHEYKHWPVAEKMGKEAKDTIAAWFVLVSSSISQYLKSSAISNEVIFLTKNSAMAFDLDESNFVILHERQLPYFLGSGFRAGLVCHLAGKTIEETFAIASELQPTVSWDYDTITQAELEDPPLNYIELVHDQLIKEDRCINPFTDILVKAVKRCRETLSETELGLLFPTLSQQG